MVVAIVLFCFLALVTLTGMALSTGVYRGPRSAHFNGRKFINPDGIKENGLWEVLKWMLTRRRGIWKANLSLTPGPKPLDSIGKGIRITFVNHSTFLIQFQGINMLTDPVWSDRASPFSWAGPKRMRPPGIRFDELPAIHFVLLSHNHYDHLDLPTVKRLAAIHCPKFITPLGVLPFLEKHNIHSGFEMDWRDEEFLSDTVRIRCVPSIHFSGRGTFDRDGTLWCGYVLKSPVGNIYFAGDTGYHPGIFKEIGDECSIDVSIIPIGAYKPNWFMSPIHCSPEEALQIHLDLKSSQSIASHFGTFALADDSQQDPLKDLSIAIQNKGISPEKFIALREGEPLDLE